MRESADLVTRIDRLCIRAAEARSAQPLLGEMENLLAEGYLEALTGEARRRRLAERLERLVEILDQPAAAVEARRIALQKRGVDDKVTVLRGRLEVMREHFVQLRGLSRSR